MGGARSWARAERVWPRTYGVGAKAGPLRDPERVGPGHLPQGWVELELVLGRGAATPACSAHDAPGMLPLRERMPVGNDPPGDPPTWGRRGSPALPASWAEHLARGVVILSLHSHSVAASPPPSPSSTSRRSLRSDLAGYPLTEKLLACLSLWVLYRAS